MSKNFLVREIKKSEHKELEIFLYEAIFVPKNILPPPREIIFQPELQIYIKNFGKCEADFCFVAESDKKIVGAAWSRIMNDYGHIDDKTPSLALSVLKNYRRQGIATALMKKLLEKNFAEKFNQVSLSVQKSNEIALNFFPKLALLNKFTHSRYIFSKFYPKALFKTINTAKITCLNIIFNNNRD